MSRTYDAVSLERRVNKKMAAQFGLITRDQAISAGMTRHVIETKLVNGLWVPAGPRIYKPGGSPDSPEQKLMAAILWAGDGAVVSHRSAAWLWRLEGRFDGVVEITLQRSTAPPPGVIVHRRDLDQSDLTRIGIFPVTRVARTIFDLAAVIPLDQLLVARDEALRRRLISWQRLCEQPKQAGRGTKGLSVFRASVNGDNQGYSDLERLFLRFCREFNLPRPQLQYEIRLKDGTSAFIDFAYPGAKLAIETDGSRHDQPVRARHDRIRTNKLLAVGWRTMRLRREDLIERPKDVASEILTCLENPRR